MEIICRIYGKIGELAQGYISPAEPFLITNLSSGSLFSDTVINTDFTGILSLEHKSSLAYNLFFDSLKMENTAALNLPGSGQFLNVIQKSNIPKGKGLSSSSADVLGILCCLNQAYSCPFSIDQLYEIAARVEPTDPLLSKELVVFNQKTGITLFNWENLPFGVYYFDCFPGIEIDTIAVTANRVIDEDHISSSQQILEGFRLAVKNEDYKTFFKSISASAQLNQSFVPKDGLAELLEYANHTDAGVFVAHSGTIMGLVVHPSKYFKMMADAQRFVSRNWNSELFCEFHNNQPEKVTV